jgi:hypothetical protein
MLLAVGGLAACTTEDGDGIDDSFLGNGKADAFGVAEGSPDAYGVLTLVNTATLDELDNAAGLSANAAKAIVHHRQGGDRMDNTADDDPIDTLTELDAIPYVGPMAFQLLLDQARAAGDVPSADPFDANFCGKDYAITPAGLRAALPEGADAALVPTTTAGVRVRTRTCVTPDNCPAWVLGTQPKMFELPNSGSPASPVDVQVPAAGVDTQVAMAFSADGRPVLDFQSTVQAGGASAMLDLEAFPDQAIPDDSPIHFSTLMLMLDGKTMYMTGKDAGSGSVIGAHCVQVLSRITDGAGDATHREMVFFARY